MQATSALINTLIRSRNVLLAAAAMTAFATSASANQLVVNGSFENLLNPGVSGGIGTLSPSQQVTNWTTNGYNFVFTSGSADTTGARGDQYGFLQLWGPGNGAANGLTASSPDGGNFIGMDGAFEVGALQQTLTGLTPGQKVNVSFYFAGAQQAGFTGATTEQFAVSLGGETYYTPILQDANHGFTGWQHQSFDFTPTTTSAVLSFLAIGTPDGEPPFSLLDGVSATSTSPVPEPSSIALLLTGFAGVGGVVRGRFRKSAV